MDADNLCPSNRRQLIMDFRNTGQNMHVRPSFVLNFWLLLSAKAEFQSDCLGLSAGNVKSLYVFGSCFVIDTSDSTTHDLARTKCTHMSYGHLAVVHVKTLAHILVDFLNSISVPKCWTGLRQYDKLDEPWGHWEWVLDGGSLRPDLVYWREGVPPDNWGGIEDCAILHALGRGLTDNACTSSRPFMCQYVNPVRERCYTQHENHRFNSSTELSDEGVMGAGMEGTIACGKKCGRHPLCFGYKIKRGDGHCWIHQDDGQWPGMEPIHDSDYDLYVMKQN